MTPELQAIVMKLVVLLLKAVMTIGSGFLVWWVNGLIDRLWTDIPFIKNLKTPETKKMVWTYISYVIGIGLMALAKWANVAFTWTPPEMLSAIDVVSMGGISGYLAKIISDNESKKEREAQVAKQNVEKGKLEIEVLKNGNGNGVPK